MERSRRAALGLASLVETVLMLCSDGVRAEFAIPSIEAFTHTPSFSEAALSADGTMLAITEPAPPNYRIVMLRIKDGQRLRSINVDGNNKLRRLLWADDK